MNIYDFDNTIYDGDSNKDLIKYAFKKYPRLVFKTLRKTKKINKDYKRGLVEFERVKETMLSFIFQIENYPKFINDFVDSHIKKIKPWYIARKTENDIIISASYELWIGVFASRLGVKNVIATRTDAEGKILGRNCKGEEKVRRLYEILPGAVVATVYSDEESDVPLLNIATRAYVIKGNKMSTYFKGYKF